MALINDPAFLDRDLGSTNGAILRFLDEEPTITLSCTGEIQVIYTNAAGEQQTETYADLEAEEITVAAAAASPTYLIGAVTFISTANQLQSVDLRALRTLTTLDLSGQTDIYSINLYGCRKLEELNLSGCTGLQQLDLKENTLLQQLNLSGCAGLQQLDLRTNTLLRVVDLTDCTGLSYLDATMLTKLEELHIDGTQLQSPGNTLLIARAAGGGNKTNQYFDADGRLLMQRNEDGSTTYYDENEVERITIDSNGAVVHINAPLTQGRENIASGNNSFAHGVQSQATGAASHSEGGATQAIGICAHAEGSSAQDTPGRAQGDYSHSEGVGCHADGYASHAEGMKTRATGAECHAEGNNTTAGNSQSHAEGLNSVASGAQSHAEGNTTTASGTCSHSEGLSTTANNQGSHAEGYRTTASGQYSHAEGNYTVAGGNESHAEGERTTTAASNSHVQGRWNNSKELGNASFAHGCGSSETTRKNALLISGSQIYILGVGGYDGTNSGTEGVMSLQQVIASMLNPESMVLSLDDSVPTTYKEKPISLWTAKDLADYNKDLLLEWEMQQEE